MFKILIIDDDPIVRTVLKRTLQSQGYEITVASNGEEGITQAKRVCPALIICDWMMPQLDGLEVCQQLKAKPEFATTFFILLTARGEVEDRVSGLDAGADEFLSKPLEINELKARVRAGLRLHRLSQDLQTHSLALSAANQKLQTQKEILEAELTEAASYVRSLLPAPLVAGPITTEALFVPSAQLGGDCFDYYWLDNNSLAIYLLDVSGHGVGSALLSTSVLNVLRTQSLPSTNFYQPGEVLRGLNCAFQMVDHSDKYFTIWYGVYNRLKRQLIYANAGHPPAVLLSCASMKELGVQSLPVGLLPEANFHNHSVEVKESSTLYVFSDGAYEIQQPNGEIWGVDALIALLNNYSKTNSQALEQVLCKIISINAKETFDDDLSLLKINFN